MGAAATPLTVRETEVLAGAAAGLTYRQIAKVLGMSPNTVKARASAAIRKLGAQHAAQAVLFAARAGHLPHRPESILPPTPNPHPPGFSRRCRHCHPVAARTT